MTNPTVSSVTEFSPYNHIVFDNKTEIEMIQLLLISDLLDLLNRYPLEFRMIYLNVIIAGTPFQAIEYKQTQQAHKCVECGFDLQDI